MSRSLPPVRPARNPADLRRGRPSQGRDTWTLVVIGCLSMIAFGLWWLRGRGDAPAGAAVIVAAANQGTRIEPQVPAPPPPVRQIAPADVAKATAGADGKLVLRQGDVDVALTLDAKLQKDVQALLDRTRVPYGAIVLMDPKTGAILAMAEHREAGDPVAAIGGLGQPDMPAASIFKVVTAAALLQAGQTPDSRVCFHGGKHGIDASHVRASPADRQCQTLTEALAHSSNAAFARLAMDHLKPGDMRAMAEKLGWGVPLLGDLALVASSVDEGKTDLDRARCAPGFAGSSLSPLHGAFLAATVANRGLAMRPQLRQGQDRAPEPMGQLLSPEVADGLAAMMTQTVAAGTGRHAFSARPRSLRGMAIAGKTGSLSNNDPQNYRHFSWFIGFAPADSPQVAVAAVAVNGLQWRVKGATLARDGLALALDHEPVTAKDPTSLPKGLDVRTASR